MGKKKKRRGRPRIDPDRRRVPQSFAATSDEIARWALAAEREGLSLSAWLRKVAEAAARKRKRR
ncbi:hypothetical protein LCGC14_1693130 [marine sediment metagenome]|uniref:Ribbon-helix-helix protein CopG domain-containing protein n=1 Tax=marine sediment metagenome TaxID=412755 RepID=A0A0F9K0R3_9ZZZZ